jgi:hypothetical protein
MTITGDRPPDRRDTSATDVDGRPDCRSGWRARLPGCADQLHWPGRAGARGGWPAGGAPAGDGDRAGRAGQDRLAAEVAGRVAGWFADGVWLAELAPVADPALVPSVVAVALGMREQAGLSWRQEPSLRRSSRSRLRLRQPSTRPAVRPTTREALICKHVTGSRTCSLEAAGAAVAAAPCTPCKGVSGWHASVTMETC